MIRKPLLLLLRFYQAAVSPHLGRWCRFEPSCSEYARQAIEAHGAGRGTWLAVCRVARCHPFHAGGHDPVPSSQRRCC
ncbi:MAG: membrane protein insertion efficiency factor YidD [Verrucomicrobiia bacterium]